MRSESTTTGRIKMGVVFVFLCLVAFALWHSGTLAKGGAAPAPTPTPATQPAPQEPNTAPAPPKPAPQQPQPEGCVKCHNNIEPMHRYNSSGDVFEKID